jgi:hypothetical protein
MCMGKPETRVMNMFLYNRNLVIFQDLGCQIVEDLLYKMLIDYTQFLFFSHCFPFLE